MPDPTVPRNYPALVVAVSNRTMDNPAHSKVSRSTTWRIMAVIADGVDLDLVVDPQVPAGGLPYPRRLVEIVVAEWRAVIAGIPSDARGGPDPHRTPREPAHAATARPRTRARAHQFERPSTTDRPGGVDA